MKAVFRSLGLSRAILPLWIHLQGTLMNSIEKSFGAADTRKFLRLLHRFREPRLKWHLVIPPVNFPIPHNEQIPPLTGGEAMFAGDFLCSQLYPSAPDVIQ